MWEFCLISGSVILRKCAVALWFDSKIERLYSMNETHTIWALIPINKSPAVDM